MKEMTRRFFEENTAWIKYALAHYSQEGSRYRHLADATDELKKDGFLNDGCLEFRRKYRDKSNSMWLRHSAIRDVMDIMTGEESFGFKFEDDYLCEKEEDLAINALQEFIEQYRSRS